MTQLAQLLWNQGFKFGSQPFLCVKPALLSYLTLPIVPCLKTNLKDEVLPKGRRLFIGIVEQQLPKARKKRVRAQSFHFFIILLSPSSTFLLFFHYLSHHTGKHNKYSRVLQVEVLHKEQHKEQQQIIKQAWGTRLAAFTTIHVATGMLTCCSLCMDIFQWCKWRNGLTITLATALTSLLTSSANLLHSQH